MHPLAIAIICKHRCFCPGALKLPSNLRVQKHIFYKLGEVVTSTKGQIVLCYKMHEQCFSSLNFEVQFLGSDPGRNSSFTIAKTKVRKRDFVVRLDDTADVCLMVAKINVYGHHSLLHNVQKTVPCTKYSKHGHRHRYLKELLQRTL